MIRAAALLLCLSCTAQADPQAEAARLAGVASAAAVAIWTDQGTEIAVHGLRQAQGAPARPEDAFHIGSLGKAMTATLAARLVMRERIRWDTSVGDLLAAAPPWADVTLAELLTHRSGMVANLPRWRAGFRPGRDAYVAHMLGTRAEEARGAFLYSNAGYVVAGAMLEAATGRTWEDLIRAEVFDPLGMKGAGFGAPPDIIGHRDADTPVPPGPRADNIAAMRPAGGLHVTADDMARFLAAHGGRDITYLPADLWDRLHRPVGDYAMGWLVEEVALAHAGSNTLWFARMRVVPDRAVFVAVNLGGATAAAETALSMSRLAGG